MLGETLTGVVTGLAGEPVTALTIAVGLGAVVVGFGAWETYFDLAGHRPPRPTRGAGLLWLLSHLPLTAAVAAMGAAMVSLITHAHDGRTPAGTAWVLRGRCRRARHHDARRIWPASVARRLGLYRPLAYTCAGVTVACVALGALRPAPLVLCLTLVLLHWRDSIHAGLWTTRASVEWAGCLATRRQRVINVCVPPNGLLINSGLCRSAGHCRDSNVGAVRAVVHRRSWGVKDWCRGLLDRDSLGPPR